jgi:hypothetical protein
MVGEAKTDFGFGDGERRMCNRSRNEVRGFKFPEDVSWEATPTWSVKR